jgi:predicted transcriptional regulator
MTMMNEIQLKSDLHSLIDRVNDMTILNAVKEILSVQVKENDFWEELPLNVRESVKRGMEQARSGKTKAHSEVMKNYEKLL